jgi:thioredoxin 1
MSIHDECPAVNSEEGLSNILKVNNQVMALFYASWCPFCVKILPAFKKHAAGGAPRFLLVQDDQETIADKYSVKVFPTLILFENGAVSKRLDGALGIGIKEERLADFIKYCF